MISKVSSYKVFHHFALATQDWKCWLMPANVPTSSIMFFFFGFLCRCELRMQERQLQWKEVLAAWGRELKLASSWNFLLANFSPMTFLLFCYFFQKLVSEYLHGISQKKVLDLFIIIDNSLFHPTRKYHFCEGQLKAHKSSRWLDFFPQNLYSRSG